MKNDRAELAGQIVSARRTVNIPWHGGIYDILDPSSNRPKNNKFTKSPWASACMDIRATELSRIPWRIKRNGKVVENSLVERMLMDFGPENNFITAIQATEIDLLLHGAAYWLRDVDIIRRLNPGSIKVEFDSKNQIKYFEQYRKGKVVNTFNRDEIIYFREYNPDDDLGRGISAVEKCKEAIETDFQATQLVNSHFKNDAIPGLMLTTEQHVSEDEANRIIAWFEKRFGGTKNKGKVGIADRGLKPEVLSANMQENAVVELRKQAREDICGVFRVPAPLVGSMVDATYVNANESRKFLIEDTILPRAAYFAEVINSDFIRKVDPSLYIEFSEDEIKVLQEDTSAKWKRLSEAYELGVITAEYLVEEMGWTEGMVPKGDIRTLNSWKRKALKAFENGESPDVDFYTDDIPTQKQVRVHMKLAQAKTKQQVEDAFYV